MYTLCIVWSDRLDLGNFKDDAAVATCDVWHEILDIAGDADFRAWARDAGCLALEIWSNGGRLIWSYDL